MTTTLDALREVPEVDDSRTEPMLLADLLQPQGRQLRELSQRAGELRQSLVRFRIV